MNKASGGDGIRVELFQILKDDAVKVLHSTCQQIWKTQQWPQDWKIFHSSPKERQFQRMFKLPHNCTHLTCQQVMLKSLQARLQQYVNHEIPDVHVGFRKGRGVRDQIAKICWIIEKTREFQKTSTSALLTTPKLLTVWIKTNCGKCLKRWEYQTREKPICRSGSNSQNWIWNNRLVPKGEMSTSRLYIVTLLI